ncbi:HNH endonuclease [Paenibacillus sp. YYML68]|uniref:HNH endonuclease n=1 Tax=Paenibacillus sp. YYML68 TaxID=2909250 RepID=UPI002492FEBB|nr:HNH endonuclease [Paenibacillus sp. YYML68]
MLYPNARIVNKYEVITMAGVVFSECDGVSSYSPKDWIEYIGINYINKVIKPHKRTLLHDYIAAIYEYHMNYLINKHLPIEVIENIIELFTTYSPDDKEFKRILSKYREFKIDFVELEAIDQSGNVVDYRSLDGMGSHFYNLFEEKIMPIVVDDVFTLLFQNKMFLKKFNESISELIDVLNMTEYPEFLKKDGVIRRCSYIPEWLKRGVFFRDKGRCQECGIDLTGLRSPFDQIHLDHIIPLDLGGTNDPTNFQLLCEKCNLFKGARHSNTKDIDIPFWSQEED